MTAMRQTDAEAKRRHSKIFRCLKSEFRLNFGSYTFGVFERQSTFGNVEYHALVAVCGPIRETWK